MPSSCRAKMKTAPVQQRGALPVAADTEGEQLCVFMRERCGCKIDLFDKAAKEESSV